MDDWKVFRGDGSQHDGVASLPEAPPWRFGRNSKPLRRPPRLDIAAEAQRAEPFMPTEAMIIAVNAALYLRRPLLITGRPGIGKSTLIAKVAHELKLGAVIRWPISSRSTVRNGIYEYDAVGRLQAGKTTSPPVEKYLTLGPLGTALCGSTWPRAILIDEIDKSDLDFANDLLNVIEEGYYEIPELRRLNRAAVKVGDHFGNVVEIADGRISGGHFPFVVMTSNAEREFPPALLRRCIRLNVEPPSSAELTTIVKAHMRGYEKTLRSAEVNALIDEFLTRAQDGHELATDQLLNAVYLTVAMKGSESRQFSEHELRALKDNLLHQLNSPVM